MEVPRPGINLSHSCNLHRSCGNTASFNPLCQGLNPHLCSDPSHCSQILNLLCKSGKRISTFLPLYFQHKKYKETEDFFQEKIDACHGVLVLFSVTSKRIIEELISKTTYIF